MSETNYASARQGAIEDEMTYQEEEEAILAILDEIYETFVISCYLTGLIKVNKDFWTKKDDYLEHGWIKSPKKWIDPLKESQRKQDRAEYRPEDVQRDRCRERPRLEAADR